MECPFPFYAALREESPVFNIPGTAQYLVSRHEDIAFVNTHPELFSNNRAWEAAYVEQQETASKPSLTPYSMAGTDPPEHRLKRRLGLRIVRRDRLKSYEAILTAVANDLIDSWIDDGECEFCAEFADPFAVTVLADILGLPRSDIPFLERLGGREAIANRFLTEDEIQLDKQLYDEASQHLSDVLLDRYEQPRDDYLSEFVAALTEQEGSFDLTYAVAESTILLTGGHVTTAHMIASAMAILCESPELIEGLRDDRSQIAPFLEEVLRLEAPVQWLIRQCKQDTELGGVAIPRGAELVVLYASGNRDESRFEDPDRFRLDRPNVVKHNLAFGHGAHFCLGAPLARMEGQIAFNILLDRLIDIRLLAEQSDLRHIEKFHFRAPKAVQIAFDAA